MVPTAELTPEALPERADAAVARDPLEPGPRPLRHARARGRRPRARRARGGGQHLRHAARAAPLELGADFSVTSATKHLCGPRRPAAGLRGRAPTRSAPRPCAAGAARPARSPGRSRPGWPTARWPRSTCASSAGARTRWRSPSCWPGATTSSGLRYPGLAERPRARARRRQMRRFGTVLCFDLGSRERAEAFLARRRAGHRGHQLRRRALERRAPRPLGRGRRARGLHPPERGLRGRRRTCWPTSSARSTRRRIGSDGRVGVLDDRGGGARGGRDLHAGLLPRAGRHRRAAGGARGAGGRRGLRSSWWCSSRPPGPRWRCSGRSPAGTCAPRPRSAPAPPRWWARAPW